MQKVDENSPLVLPQCLDLFSNPLTTAGIDYCRFTEIGLTSSPDVTPYEFRVVNQRCFLDLQKSYLIVRFKIVGDDGKAISDDTTTDMVAATNFAGAALFRQVQCYINGKLVSDSGPGYPYRHYIQNVVSCSEEYKHSFMQVMGYTDDRDLRAATDSGYLVRVAACQKSSTMEIATPISCDVMNQPRALLPFVEFKLILYPSANEFAIDRRKGSKKYAIKIEDMKLMMKEIYVYDSVLLSCENLLKEKRFITYPIVSLTTRTFHIPGGRRLVPEARLGLAKLPKRVIVVLVDAAAYNGHFDKNPFYFETANLQNISIQAGPHVIPFRGMQNDFKKHLFARSYLALMEGMGFAGQGTNTNGISPKEFENGYAIFVFDIVGHSSGLADYNVTRLGDTSISFEFSQDTPASGLYAVCLIESDSTFQITAEREPTIDTLV